MTTTTAIMLKTNLRTARFAQLTLVLAAMIFGVGTLAHASEDQKAEAFVLCKNKKDVRTIRIVADHDKVENCMITYSKGAMEEVVGSNRSSGSCKSILKGIQHTLETSHWSCRNVQSAMITTSSEVSRQ